MSKMRLKFLGILAAALAACGVVATVAFSQSEPRGVPGERSAAPAVGARVAANFAVFRREEAPSDRMRAAAAPRAVLGANTDHARFATTSSSGERFFLVPGDEAVCIATERAGVTTCGQLDGSPDDHVALEGSFCGIDVPDGKYRLVLAVADGVRGVRVVEADGGVTKVPVVNNVAIYEGDKAAPVPEAVHWSTRSGGTGGLTRPVPADALGPCSTPGG
jgi:hypothetical protein